MTRSLAEVEADATELIRRYLRADDSEKTATLRKIAEAFIELRSMFIDSDGVPDWSGKSHAYRQTTSRIYGDANVPPESKATVRAAIGYHVSNMLRERLDDDDLADANLRRLSARARSVEKRTKQSAILGVLRTGPMISSTDEVMHALTAARALLARIPDATVANASADERREVREALAEVEAEAGRLTAVAGKLVRRKG